MRSKRVGEALEAAPDAVVEVDRDGGILPTDKVTERLFGYTRQRSRETISVHVL